MLANGATTLWERWEQATGSGMNSHNHPMMGSIGSWLYRALAGIIANPDGPGFSKVQIKPNFVNELVSIDIKLETVKGLILSSWLRENDQIHLNISIPVGCEAELFLPIKENWISLIEEDNNVIWGRNGQDSCENVSVRETPSHIIINLGNGYYHFNISVVNT